MYSGAAMQAFPDSGRGGRWGRQNVDPENVQEALEPEKAIRSPECRPRAKRSISPRTQALYAPISPGRRQKSRPNGEWPEHAAIQASGWPKQILFEVHHPIIGGLPGHQRRQSLTQQPYTKHELARHRWSQDPAAAKWSQHNVVRHRQQVCRAARPWPKANAVADTVLEERTRQRWEPHGVRPRHGRRGYR